MKSAWRIHKDAVKAIEQSYGVPLKRVKMGKYWYYIAELPEDHPLTKKTGNRRHLIKVKSSDGPRPDPRCN